MNAAYGMLRHHSDSARRFLKFLRSCDGTKKLCVVRRARLYTAAAVVALCCVSVIAGSETASLVRSGRFAQRPAGPPCRSAPGSVSTPRCLLFMCQAHAPPQRCARRTCCCAKKTRASLSVMQPRSNSGSGVARCVVGLSAADCCVHASNARGFALRRVEPRFSEREKLLSLLFSQESLIRLAAGQHGAARAAGADAWLPASGEDAAGLFQSFSCALPRVSQPDEDGAALHCAATRRHAAAAPPGLPLFWRSLPLPLGFFARLPDASSSRSLTPCRCRSATARAHPRARRAPSTVRKEEALRVQPKPRSDVPRLQTARRPNRSRSAGRSCRISRRCRRCARMVSHAWGLMS